MKTAAIKITGSATPPPASGWKLKIAVLLIIAVPAFSGYPLHLVAVQVIPGISASWCLYALVVNLAVLALHGCGRYADIITLAAMITMPVVFSGAIVSHLAGLTGLSPRPPALAAVHYIQLCLTMLAVIPLALGIVTSIPFEAAEQKLLQNSSGVTARQKKLLMILRVFNHICFTVMANLVEIIREERNNFLKAGNGSLSALIGLMRHAAVECICSAVQFIPLWAIEIGSLPGPSPSIAEPAPNLTDQEEQ